MIFVMDEGKNLDSGLTGDRQFPIKLLIQTGCDPSIERHPDNAKNRNDHRQIRQQKLTIEPPK
jgi:hypothetical protein